MLLDFWKKGSKFGSHAERIGELFSSLLQRPHPLAMRLTYSVSLLLRKTVVYLYFVVWIHSRLQLNLTKGRSERFRLLLLKQKSRLRLASILLFDEYLTLWIKESQPMVASEVMLAIMVCSTAAI